MDPTNNSQSLEKNNIIIVHLENNRKVRSIIEENRAIDSYKQKHKWSEEEKEELLKGVSKYGEGKWQLILNSSKIFHPSRNSVDLKDKFRLLKKMSSYYRSTKQNWCELLEDNTIRLDALGTPKAVLTRFPYDAAKVFAEFRSKDEVQPFILRLVKKESTEPRKIHIYNVNLDQDKWKITKKETTYSSKIKDSLEIQIVN